MPTYFVPNHKPTHVPPLLIKHTLRLSFMAKVILAIQEISTDMSKVRD